MIEYYLKKENENVLKKEKSFSNNCWINVVNPNEEEISFLVKEFGVDRSNLNDGLDIYENPRFEIVNKKAYIYLTTPTNKIKEEHDSSFLIVYSKNYFMTVSKYSLEILNEIFNSKIPLGEFGNPRKIIKILFLLSRFIEKSVHKILKETKKNKADFSKLKNKDIEKLIHYEDELNNYISSFGFNIGTYNRILRDNSLKILKFLKRDEDIIEDLIIDMNETLNLCKQTSKAISNMRNYYSTKLSNDLNRTVTVLTIATIFISIPTLISGIYGMNIALPFQNFKYIFPSLMGIAFGIGAIFLIILKGKKIF